MAETKFIKDPNFDIEALLKKNTEPTEEKEEKKETPLDMMTKSQNEKGMVSARMTKEEYDAAQSEKFVEENFGGSLPAFLAAFTTRKKLNKSEVDEIKKMIDAIGKEG